MRRRSQRNLAQARHVPLSSGCRQVTGPNRVECGDRYAVGPTWAVVADGVGSLPPHELASSAAVAAASWYMARAPREPDPLYLGKVFSAAWNEVIEAATDVAGGQIATTMTVAWAGSRTLQGGRPVLIGWVGDSPAGSWESDGTLVRWTEPHHEDGEARSLSRAVSPLTRCTPEMRWRELREGAALWVASDGVTIIDEDSTQPSTDLAAWTTGAMDDATVAVVVP